MNEPALAVILLIVSASVAAPQEMTLHNGIRLADDWPPRIEALTREPPPDPPYLVEPPQVIPINVGRQLFVDDFLIEDTDLTRTHHVATYIDHNPLVVPDKPWEMETEHPTAMVFSDGVWYDPQDRLFKMWYMGGYVQSTCYATSEDGLQWEKPELDVVPGTNVVDQVGRDSGTVWLDEKDPDPARRFKMFTFRWPEGGGRLTIQFSADGIHWSEPVGYSGPLGDRSSVFFDPFRDVWVYSIREYLPETIGRCRRYSADADVLKAAEWEAGEPTFWVGADDLDAPREDLNTPCQLYNLDCAAYESLLIGLFSIWRGQPGDRPKPNEVCIGYSRDGFHWSRPMREAFIPVSEQQGDWNWGNVQSAGGCCLVVGDELWFYVSGRAGVPGTSGSGVCSTGLAKLRRDGFASMDSPGYRTGTLTTRPVTFDGEHLFVNAVAPRGELRVEVLTATGEPIEGFSERECLPFRGDSTCQRIGWGGQRDLPRLSGQPVRFRFHLRGGGLYAFWVSPDESGDSRGYVAAGGPKG